MDELTQKKAEREEAFTKYVYHQSLAQKHEQAARKWRHAQLDLNDEIRFLERQLSSGVKLVYGE